MHDLVKDMDQLDLLMPQMLAQLPPMIATMQSMRTMILTMHSTMSGIFGQMDEQSTNATAMGRAFDTAKDDDSFYLAADIFKNKDFQRILNVFVSPDGKAARMLITQSGDPATPEGIARVDPIKSAAEEALKATPLEDAKIYLTGTAAMTKDIVDGSKYDLLIAGVAALCLIFIIMLMMTRSLIAALVIVGTVALSLGASFGLSVLVWQYLLGTQLHYVVLVMSVIVLLAVGSDYNLLLVSRMKEEIGAGINTGIIRAMAGTGKVVTNAGLVFAFTMASMAVSDLRSIAQLGTTIGLGLLFDTLVVRAFMTPSVAALLGRWFWWPQRVRPRPASSLLRSSGPRPLVRALLLREQSANGGVRGSERASRRGDIRADRTVDVSIPGVTATTPARAFTWGMAIAGRYERRTPPTPSFAARAIRRSSPLVILAWVALTLLVTFAVPSLEDVGDAHSVSLAPQDAPAAQAMKRMGKDFKESDSDSFAMIVLEGQQPLGDDARSYYADLVRELRGDPKHVEHVQDLWGDRLTATGAQSPDGKAAYVQLNLAGNQGTTVGEESVAAVRSIVDRTPPPPGVKVYLTGAAPLVSEMQHTGNKSILKITVAAAAIICVVLLVVYRSIITVILLLVMVGIELLAARGTVAYLGHLNLFGLSTVATNFLVALGMAAGTDYGIFFFGRYQEARQAGEDRETAYYTAYRGVAPVVLASGLTIAGAILCLSFTRLPYFHSLGVPCAVGMLVTVAVAVTLVPAVLAVGGRFGLFDPKRRIGVYRWRRVGTAIVRWPVPILAGACAIALMGLLALPGYRTSYNDRLYLPKDIPANQGYAAADRHFSQARMMPEILLLESDHDLRNPSDFLILNRVAKAILKIQGISRVQGITRPEGTPIEHTSIPFLLSVQNAACCKT